MTSSYVLLKFMLFFGFSQEKARRDEDGLEIHGRRAIYNALQNPERELERHAQLEENLMRLLRVPLDHESRCQVANMKLCVETDGNWKQFNELHFPLSRYAGRDADSPQPNTPLERRLGRHYLAAMGAVYACTHPRSRRTQRDREDLADEAIRHFTAILEALGNSQKMGDLYLRYFGVTNIGAALWGSDAAARRPNTLRKHLEQTDFIKQQAWFSDIAPAEWRAPRNMLAAACVVGSNHDCAEAIARLWRADPSFRNTTYVHPKLGTSLEDDRAGLEWYFNNKAAIDKEAEMLYVEMTKPTSPPRGKGGRLLISAALVFVLTMAALGMKPAEARILPITGGMKVMAQPVLD